jgi:putative transposase
MVKSFGRCGTILHPRKEIHTMQHRSFQYRLSPTQKQADTLQWILDRTRELYHAAVQERRDAYEVIKHRPDFYDRQARKQAGQTQNITYFSQANQLSEIKDDREEYKDIHSQILQDVLKRVDKAFKAFFRRCASGATPGYPRFQGRDRYDSFTYPQGGYSLSIKREGEQWYVVFSCEVQAEPLSVSETAVGIDLGVVHFATLSTGETIENPRYLRRGEQKLKVLHQSLSTKKRGSHV